jgi:signal transduction histidine kinase
MAAEASRLRSIQQSRPSRGALSRKQVEALLSRSVAAFGVLFAIQTIPSVLLQHAHRHEQPQWTELVVAIFCLILGGAFLAAIAQRWVKLTTAAFAICYLLAIASWPLASRSPLESSDGTHWLYYLLTVATAMAAIAFKPPVATVYLVTVPTCFGIAAVVTNGGATTRADAILSASYSIILGGIVLIVIAMLRQAASTVDKAQSMALESYAEAVRQHATEVERVQVDAIVHDSVLTTLLSAARAHTPEARALSAQMAANAIGFLHQAAVVGPDDGSTISSAALAQRVTLAAMELGVAFELRAKSFAPRSIPVVAAEAVYSAAVQAMVNSAQHAGRGSEVSRWISIRGDAPLGLEVEVGDTGAGFSPSEVPDERLGVRVSILERVAHAGGAAEVDSQPGEGTVVTIRWPSGLVVS